MAASNKTARSILAKKRNDKSLLLPMPRPKADTIVLQVRIGLEAIRNGHGDQKSVLNMDSMIVLTELLTIDGFGALPVSEIREARAHVTALIEHGTVTGTWEVPATLADALTPIVNEYDRMLHHVRMHAVLAAMHRVDALLSEASAEVFKPEGSRAKT